MITSFENKDELIYDSLPPFILYTFSKENAGNILDIDYANNKLCDLTGFDKSYFINSSSFRQIILKNDLRKFDDNLSNLLKSPSTSKIEYRIKAKNGHLYHIREESSSVFSDDKIFISSIFFDITELKTENESLSFLNKALPCGIAKFTYINNHPKITYLNDQMKVILKLPDSVETNINFKNSNLFFMIPPSDKRKFQLFLKQVLLNKKAIMGQMNVFCFDGSIARLHGWVTKIKNKNGDEEFQSVCVDITETYNQQKQTFTNKYIQALSEVYDRIFEYDFSKNTVTYLKGKGLSSFSAVKNIPMQMQEAVENWVQNTIPNEDQERIKNFFKEVIDSKNSHKTDTPPLIKYTALSNEGKYKNYIGVFIKIDDDSSLFCCRNISSDIYLQQENYQLKNINQSIQELVSKFTDGIVAFEIHNNFVRPLYSSENLLHFFGYSQEEWSSFFKNPKTLEEFVSLCKVDYEDFINLLSSGEGEFSYYDFSSKKISKIKAICSKLGTNKNEFQYIFLYNIHNNSLFQKNTFNSIQNQKSVYIRTFGYFDVFINDQPILFRNKKSKELLALLVDRKGGYISSEEAISFLWEDEPTSALTLARYRKVALRLKNTLEEYDIANIIESVDGKRRIVSDNVKCDLFDYLEDQKNCGHLFKGSYLSNYSWAETTLGELLNERYQ